MQEARARAAKDGSRKPAGRIGRGREWVAFIGAILYEPSTPPVDGAGGGRDGAGRWGGVVARPRAGGDSPRRPPAAGPDHRQGWASAGPGWGAAAGFPPTDRRGRGGMLEQAQGGRQAGGRAAGQQGCDGH